MQRATPSGLRPPPRARQCLLRLAYRTSQLVWSARVDPTDTIRGPWSRSDDFRSRAYARLPS